MEHQLKTWPEYFEETWSGRKTFEIRKNDRNYKVGDEVLLREYDPKANKYTDRTLVGVISYVTDYEQKEGYVVFGIADGD